jgi:hypothetical protein
MNSDFDVEVTTAWWFTPYIYILAFLCTVMNTEIDEERVKRTIAKAIKLKAVVK